MHAQRIFGISKNFPGTIKLTSAHSYGFSRHGRLTRCDVRYVYYHSSYIKMITNALSVIVCSCSFVYTCYILCSLTYFLSSHNDKREIDDNTTQSILWSLFINMSLLTGFVLQHSIMATDMFKYILCRLHMDYLNRSIYNACSSVAIHLLINKWQQISTTSLWNINTCNNIVWMLFSGLHVFAWSTIYSGCIMMDIAELCGLKQVFYKLSGRSSPLNNKSMELKRYMQHMRHPSLTGFLIILWLHPFMSLDRLLLATILTMYMVLMWTIDFDDYSYHILYYRRKQIELS